MRNMSNYVAHGVIVEEQVQFSLVELSRVCHADVAEVVALVHEGVLTAKGENPQHWRFGGNALRRTRVALRLTHDMELSASDTALVFNLLDEIEMLRTQLRCANPH